MIVTCFVVRTRSHLVKQDLSDAGKIETDKQKDKQTDRQTDRKTNRQTDIVNRVVKTSLRQTLMVLPPAIVKNSQILGVVCESVPHST